jgi:glycosyltransferase involved in cell wall biosynthesis
MRGGPNSPKLVLVGSRSRTTGAVVDMLEKCQIIKNHVVEIGGLSSSELCQVLAGARALLMPSFAEGFGLPIIEALALGTPVIASDLATHREAGGSYATYLSPLDGPGWLAAIRTHANDDVSESRARAFARSYRPRTWSDYFHAVEPFICSTATP